MSDQEKDLQQRLRDAAAHPRTEWVERLRGELEAAWQTGAAPGRTHVSIVTSRRPTMRIWAAAGVAAVVIGTAVFAFGGRSDPNRIGPAPIDPAATVPVGTDSSAPPITEPAATVPADTAPSGTDPSGTDPAATDASVVPACTPKDPALWKSNVYVTFTATAVWRLHPDGCTDDAGRWTGFTFTTTVIADASTTTYHLATDTLVAAGVTLGREPDPWWNAVTPVGVQGNTVILQADGYRQIVRVDLQAGTVTVTVWPERNEAEAFSDRRVYLVDDQLFGFEMLYSDAPGSYYAPLGSAAWSFDEITGTADVIDDPLLAGATPFGQVVEDGLLPPAQHHLMLHGGQGLLRLDADGSVRDITAPGYSYFSVTTSGDNVWSIVLAPDSSGAVGTDANGGQVVEGAHGARLDVDTGAVILAPPNPPGAADGETARTGLNGSLYFMHRTRQAWWLGNDGSVTTLRAFDGIPVGVIDDGRGTDLLVLITGDREPTVTPLIDLLDEVVTPPTTG